MSAGQMVSEDPRGIGRSSGCQEVHGQPGGLDRGGKHA